MTDILYVIGGVLLVTIPVSMVLTVFYRPTFEQEFGEMGVGDFFLIWLFSYIFSLLFAAVGFAGVVGFAMLAGAFQ